MRDWLGEAKSKQVYLILRDRILSGAFGFGVKLPTENKLAKYYAVSRVTVRRALGELARERLIERRRSAGTRVIYRPAPAPMTADISGVLANLAEMGRRTAVKLLSFDYVPADGAVAQALGVGADQMLQRSVRVRAVDRVPFSYLTTHVPESVAVTFTSQELASRPLLELLERAGVQGRACAAAHQRRLGDARRRRSARGAHRIAADRTHSRRAATNRAGLSSTCMRSTGPTATPSRWTWCAPARPTSEVGRRSCAEVSRRQCVAPDAGPMNSNRKRRSLKPQANQRRR